MAKIFYHAVPVDWRREEKYDFLERVASIAGVDWKQLKPDDKFNWLTSKNDEEFDEFLPIGSKEAKAGTSLPVIFKTYSLGVSTNRDDVVSDVGLRSPFSCLVSNLPSNLHFCASTDAFQSFPIFTYSSDGKEHYDNITGQALIRFLKFP